MPERVARVSSPRACGEPRAYSRPANPSLVNENPCSLLGQSFLRRDSEGDETFFEIDQVQISRHTGPNFTLKYRDPERYSYNVSDEEIEHMLTDSFSLDEPHSNDL